MVWGRSCPDSAVLHEGLPRHASSCVRLVVTDEQRGSVRQRRRFIAWRHFARLAARLLGSRLGKHGEGCESNVRQIGEMNSGDSIYYYILFASLRFPLIANHDQPSQI